ncbi:MAG: MmcQ/YjbR family DNA-binding protein [Dehalococcoidia bacterium]
MTASLGTVRTSRERFSQICLRLPEATERGGQHSAFKVREKTFAYYLDSHHGDGRLSVQVKGGPGAQDVLIQADPGRFFVAPYIGHRGWVGLYLDVGEIDWDEVEALTIESYRLVAPTRLAALVG